MKTINNFEIIRELGRGGMGTVYLAKDAMLGRHVAIKMLNPDMLHRKDVIDRFKSEAMTLATLNQRNIATLYNLLEVDGKLFMVMEFVDGQSFEEILKERKKLPAEEVVELALQGCKGLHHAHNKKVVHRDLKPGNFMLSNDNIVKVMDFGIARVLGSSRMTQVGNMVGTLEYMAPEQIKGEEGDARSDVYAMGIILFEMITGQVPFATKSEYDLMTMKLKNTAPSMRSFDPSIDPGLDKIIAKSLSPSPDKRFQTIQKLEEELGYYLHKKKFTAQPSSSGSFDLKKIAAGISAKLPDTKTISDVLPANFSLKHLAAALGIILILFGAYQWRQARLANVNKPESEITKENEVNDDEAGSNVLAINDQVDDFVPPTPVEEDVPEIIEETKKPKEEVRKPVQTRKKDPVKRSVKDNGSNSSDKTREEDVADEKENSEPKSQPKTYNVLLNSGTEMTVRLGKEISSNDVSMRGKMVTFEVTEPVIKNGLTVIPSGSLALGRVLVVRPHRGRKKSLLEIRVLHVEILNGVKIRLRDAVFEKIGYSGGEVSYNKGQTFKVRSERDQHLTLTQ